jgi:branched-chain amino acid transport system ATP-binding protein
MTFFKVERISKSFGKLKAVDNVHFELAKGELVALIGPNGAGKTTLFNLITGRLKPDSGRVIFKDEEITGLPPHEIIRKSLGRSFQISNIYATLSVYQNIRIPILSIKGKGHIFFKPVGVFRDEHRKAIDIINKLGLEGEKDLSADVLSHGDRRKLEMGMTIATDPTLLLLDEPTAGMNPTETEKTISLIKALTDDLGLTLILTEHDMKVVFSLAKRIIVMHYGKVICDGPPERVKEDETVRKVYLGEEDWLY